MNELTLHQKKISLDLFQFMLGFLFIAGVLWCALTLISGNGFLLIYGLIGLVVCCIIFVSFERMDKIFK